MACLNIVHFDRAALRSDHGTAPGENFGHCGHEGVEALLEFEEALHVLALQVGEHGRQVLTVRSQAGRVGLDVDGALEGSGGEVNVGTAGNLFRKHTEKLGSFTERSQYSRPPFLQAQRNLKFAQRRPPGVHVRKGSVQDVTHKRLQKPPTGCLRAFSEERCRAQRQRDRLQDGALPRVLVADESGEGFEGHRQVPDGLEILDGNRGDQPGCPLLLTHGVPSLSPVSVCPAA